MENCCPYREVERLKPVVLLFVVVLTILCHPLQSFPVLTCIDTPASGNSRFNEPPVITGQTPDPVIALQNTSFQIQLGNLLVSDPDNVFPDDFSLEILDGDHYSVTGATVTPDVGYTGTLGVPVRVYDGQSYSEVYELAVEVQAIDPVPDITGQLPFPLVTNEDAPFAISLSNLLVTDEDSAYPGGFSLVVGSGSNYTVFSNVVTPSPDYFGDLSVPVTVSDGQHTSKPYHISVVVNPVNDAPVITGHEPLNTTEGHGIDIGLSDLHVTDPDNTYPADFTLSLVASTDYSVAGNTVVPRAGFNGLLSVGVFVNDGAANSAVYNLAIQVTPVNNAPEIVGQHPVTTAEDTPLTVSLDDLVVVDEDDHYPDNFTLHILEGEGYSFSGATITPSLNFSGTLAVHVKVSDGEAESESFPLQVTVTPVNDAPVITGQRPVDATENQPFSIAFEYLEVSDPDNVYPDQFTLVVLPGNDYAVSGITVTPQSGYTGPLQVAVMVNDGVLNSNIFDLSVQVAEVNDPPVITGQVPVSILEDSPFTITLAHLTVVDNDDLYPAGFTLEVLPGDHYAVSGATVTPVENFAGTLNVGVIVNDGKDDSAPFAFQIQVGDANDPPVITGQLPLSTREEQPLTVSPGHLIVTDPDNVYPAGFSLIISEGENYSVSGSMVTPVKDFFGELVVSVRVNDGINNSATFDLRISVEPVNDPPYFDPIEDLVVAENSGSRNIQITGISPGPGEKGQQITFVARSGNTAVIGDPVINHNGSAPVAMLTYTPKAATYGQVTITVTAIDDGPGAPPHENTFSWSFSVTVTDVNDPPTLDPPDDITIAEDSPEIAIPLTGISAGGNDNQPLSVTVSTNRPELFEVLAVQYSSPQPGGQLRVKPAPNRFGRAAITVMVKDNGPAVGSVSRTFTCAVTEINDAPVFLSDPVTLAAVGEAYEYIVQIEDVESSSLPISLAAAPSWLTISPQPPGAAHIRGTPPPGSSGTADVVVRIKDADIVVDQSYSLTLNNRPVLSEVSASLREDEALLTDGAFFHAQFTDVDGDPLQAVAITSLPVNGTLRVGSQQVAINDTITAPMLDQLTYHPDQDYWGTDGFYWKGFDGYHFSAKEANVSLVIDPVNDVPRIVLEQDTLRYDVTGDPVLLTEVITLVDPDDDSLTRVDLSFRMERFEPEFDRLLFAGMGDIRGSYDYQLGRLTLTGKASLDAYTAALRTVRYHYLNAVDPLPGLKFVAIMAHDGTATGDPVDRVVSLEHTFVELEIPSGFTPNGDQTNDTWVISRPGGLDQLEHAVIRVVNVQGVEVYRAVGFDSPWDGRYNGELLPAGPYFFTIDLRLRNRKRYNGVVTILR